MKSWLFLAAHSAWNRRYALSLVALSIALSTFLLLGIERVRADVRDNFAQAVSGTDLIVGPRTGAVQLLLYSVFRIGQPSHALRWRSAEALAEHPAVAWTVPIALGDSHRGHTVVGTTPAYFQHFRHGDRQALQMAQGRAFDGVFEAVLGADVAERLGLRLGQALVLSHGDGAIAENDHDDHPFTIVGILARTGTPVDRSVHVPLAGLEALHLDWAAGAPLPGLAASAGPTRPQDLTPRSITAVLVGLKQRAAVFSVRRWVDDYRAEPLMGILPGVALDELWDLVGVGEQALRALSGLIALVSLAGLVAVILAGLDERRRELAILRAVGAAPRQLMWLLAAEGGLITLSGVLAGLAAHLGAVALLGDWVAARYGIALRLQVPDAGSALLLAAVLSGGWLASLLPGVRAYRLSLVDGLTPRI